MGKGAGGGGMGEAVEKALKALDTPCSQIMVRTALDGVKEWTIIEMQVAKRARTGTRAAIRAGIRRGWDMASLLQTDMGSYFLGTGRV